MIQATREEMLDIVWGKAEPFAFVLKEAFVRALDDWDIYPAYHKGVMIAILMEKGSELHFETTGSGLGFPRKDLFAIVQRMIDKYGHVVTKTPKGETRQRRFNETIGFKVVGEDEYDIHYRIERIRGYRRGSECQ